MATAVFFRDKFASSRHGRAERDPDDSRISEALSLMMEVAAPNNPLENNLIMTGARAKLFDESQPGKTWYGSNIENASDQNKPEEERYDETTSTIAVKLGDILNLSPKKIQNLMDSYGGVWADYLIPATTPQAERGYLESKFVIDPVYSNTLSKDFYKEFDEATKTKNSGKSTAQEKEESSALYRYLNKQKTSVADLYDQIQEIQASKTLTKKEKQNKVRELRTQINDVYDKALGSGYAEAVNKVYDAALKSENLPADADEDDIVDELYLRANRAALGAEYALKTYNKDVYEKAQELKRDNGISYDTTYDFYMAQKAIKADDSLTKKEQNAKIRDMIYRLNIPSAQKQALDEKFLTDNTFIPQDITVDYSDDESYRITQLSDSQQKKWPTAKSWGFTPQQYKKYAAAANIQGKKADRVNALYGLFDKEYGDKMTNSEKWAWANRFYKLIHTTQYD